MPWIQKIIYNDTMGHITKFVCPDHVEQYLDEEPEMFEEMWELREESLGKDGTIWYCEHENCEWAGTDEGEQRQAEPIDIVLVALPYPDGMAKYHETDRIYVRKVMES